jgi:hypothetical protein
MESVRGGERGDFEILVEVELYAHGKQVCMPQTTTFGHCGDDFKISSTISFPVMIQDLPLHAVLVFTLYACIAPKALQIIGGSTFPLFGEDGQEKQEFHTGRWYLFVHHGQRGDGIHSPTKTPGHSHGGSESADRMRVLEKRVQTYGNMRDEKDKWLNDLFWRQFVEMQQRFFRESQDVFIAIQLPLFSQPILYHEHPHCSLLGASSVKEETAKRAIPRHLSRLRPESKTMQKSKKRASESDLRRGTGHGESGSGVSGASGMHSEHRIRVLDPFADVDVWPEEDQHEKITRYLAVDARGKPDAQTLETLRSILDKTCLDPLSMEERRVIWRYRYYLKEDHHALTKFLRAIDWNDPSEVAEAHRLLSEWSLITTTEALELLSGAFRYPEVRTYAVSVLERAPDSEIQTYLLQLVQALRYEDRRHEGSSLITFLFHRAHQSDVIACFLFWYLFVESDQYGKGSWFHIVLGRLIDSFLKDDMTSSGLKYKMVMKERTFLKSLRDTFVELSKGGDKRPRKIERLQEMIRKGQESGEGPWGKLFHPAGHRGGSGGIPLIGSADRGDVQKRHGSSSSVTSSVSITSSSVFHASPASAATVAVATLPIDPSFKIRAVNHHDAYIFKSALLPLRITLVGDGEKTKTVIYKRGDDLRQDQLVLQMFRLMDSILCRNGLDLHITPYFVLATSSYDGLIECVPNVRGFASLVSDYRGEVVQFLQEHYPDPTADFKVQSFVMDNYVRSLAGYSVLTFLLGIGDRHLDNIMLAPDGRIMHIDFGYIFGRDPKPYPPAMKLSKEILHVIGGVSGPHFARFLTLCCEAFNILRREANTILNLLMLMVDANIPDLSMNGKTDSLKILMKVQNRFCLGLTDEEAAEYLQSMISESMRAVFPQITEAIHRMAQQLRS